jgi:hypothetical protein
MSTNRHPWLRGLGLQARFSGIVLALRMREKAAVEEKKRRPGAETVLPAPDAGASAAGYQTAVPTAWPTAFVSFTGWRRG